MPAWLRVSLHRHGLPPEPLDFHLRLRLPTAKSEGRGLPQEPRESGCTTIAKRAVAARHCATASCARSQNSLQPQRAACPGGCGVRPMEDLLHQHSCAWLRLSPFREDPCHGRMAEEARASTSTAHTAQKAPASWCHGGHPCAGSDCRITGKRPGTTACRDGHLASGIMSRRRVDFTQSRNRLKNL